MNSNSRVFLSALILSAFVILSACKTTPKDDSLDIRLEQPASLFNPILPGSNAYTKVICQQIVPMMVAYDPAKRSYEPYLIKQIPVERLVADGPRKGQLAYDFELDEAAKWDNGQPVTAADVVFTFKIVLNPAQKELGQWRGYLEDLTDIEPDPNNPRKFTVYLRQYYMLGLETVCQIPVFPAYHYDPDNLLGKVNLSTLLDLAAAEALLKSDSSLAVFARQFVSPKFTGFNGISGAGPYRIVSSDEQQTVLEKKENWWGDKTANPLQKAYSKKITYKYTLNENEVTTMLRNKALDEVANMSIAKFNELKQDAYFAENYNFDTMWTPTYQRWFFNLNNPILADKEVRKALARVVDYDLMINTINQGIARRVVGPVHPSQPYYARQIQPVTFDVQQARTMLQNAGWSDSDNDGILDKKVNGQSRKLSIELLSVMESEVNKQIANSIVENARKAGIEIRLNNLKLSDITKRTREGNYESAMLASSFPPVLAELYQQYHSKSIIPLGDNRAFFANPEADSLISAIRHERDAARRNQMYLRVQEVIYEEMPEVPLYTSYNRFITSKNYTPVFSPVRPGYMENLFKQQN